jgi:hypothetical protein
MRMVPVAALWLAGSLWHGVVPALEALGHRSGPLTLLGWSDRSAPERTC